MLTRIQLEATMDVGSTSNLHYLGQAYWVGMQPEKNDVVLQNAIANLQSPSGSWTFLTEYCF